jgi:hypothetical protein
MNGKNIEVKIPKTCPYCGYDIPEGAEKCQNWDKFWKQLMLVILFVGVFVGLIIVINTWIFD